MIYDWTSEISEDDLMDEWMKGSEGRIQDFKRGLGWGPLERLEVE